MIPDKARVVAAFRAAVAVDLDASLKIVGAARDEATGGESRAENQYDTRATEASYLAAGQGRRILGLRALAAWLDQLDPGPVVDRIAHGALAGLRRGAAVEWVLFAPEGGGTVAVDGVEIKLISLRSPLGEVLDGLTAGDREEIDTPRGPVELEIVAIR